MQPFPCAPWHAKTEVLETGAAHLQLPGVAAAAGVAVEELFAAADSADAARAAVELLLLRLIVKKRALQTHVCTCSQTQDTAVRAQLRQL
jgi:hypothetical protein